MHDACTRISIDRLRPMLFGDADGTLDSWSRRPTDDTVTCRWEGRPHGNSDVNVVLLDVVRYPSASDATVAFRGHLDYDRDRSDAIADTADGVVRTDPDVAYARRGREIARVDAVRARQAEDRSEERYRIEAAALEAVGARVAPLPDPADWMPPRHVPGPVATALEPLVAAYGFVVTHRFLLMPVIIVLGVASAGVAARLRAPRLGGVLVVLSIAFAVANVVLGPWIGAYLIYRTGTSAPATITGTFDPGVIYNSHNVVGYDVLIKTANGTALKSSFQDDDFNIYPSGNGVYYPDVGTYFSVRYLPHFPHRFVIVANDDSPWALSLRCALLEKPVAEARRRHAFAPHDPSAAAALEHDLALLRAGGCTPSTGDSP